MVGWSVRKRLEGTNRIGKCWAEVLERLAFTQCFLVFVGAYCETRNVSSKEDPRSRKSVPRDRWRASFEFAVQLSVAMDEVVIVILLKRSAS